MKVKTIILGFLSIIMAHCAVYHPQTVDIPLISKKGDVRIDAGISLIPSAIVTVSYGLTNKIAIQAFGSFGSDERYFAQGAVGYYKAIGNKKIMELYGGFGYGYGSIYKDSRPGHLQGNFQLYFTQFNYGKTDCKFAHLDYGFGVKAGYLNSHLEDRNYYDFYSFDEPFTTYKYNNLFIEPGLFARLGGQKLKINFKLGGCVIYKFVNSEKHLPYGYINFGLGINYRL
jgi:hypothetical protein